MTITVNNVYSRCNHTILFNYNSFLSVYIYSV